VLSDPASGEHPVTGPTLSIGDIPQSTYRDWAAWLLPIEPEYAMDAPTIPQLKRWFSITILGFAVAAVLTGVCLLTSWVVFGRKAPHSVPTTASSDFATPLDQRLPPSRLRWLLPLLWFVQGALGTTFLSSHYDEFLFTWPVCLFVLFQAVVYQTRSRKSVAGNAWLEWFWQLAFGLVCFAYYVLCRRLSLAFEWMFLAGFPAAVPFLLLARQQAAARRLPILREWLCLLAAYGCFYWLSAGLLIWKYHSAA
jgi:hypothetical protein